MSTLYLDRKNLSLKLDGHALSLYENNEKRGTIPLKMLEKIIVRGNIQLETRLLGACSENQVDVLFLSGRNNTRQTATFRHSHADVRRRLSQMACVQNLTLQQDLVRQLVIGKVNKQQHLLTKALEARPDQRLALTKARQTLTQIIQKISDPTLEITIDQFRGYEGSAAAAYFSAYTQLFAPSLNFNQRQKRPPKDPVNACLSLGYTLLHFEAVSVCHQVGLEPLLGFYHEPCYGRESLACDLIEPLRPRLDEWIWELFRQRQLNKDHFSNEPGGCLLNKAGRKLFYAGYESWVYPIRRLLRMQGHKLARFYLQTGQNIL
jgi:CRISPR-associated protein Cas1